MEDVTGLQLLAERVSAGDEVTEADASILLESRDLIAIGAIADDARRRIHGARTTFVRVFEIHVDALPAALPPSVAAGEIRIVGSPASLESAVAAVAAARTLAGSVPLTGFGLTDVRRLSTSLGDAARRLREAGLDAIAAVPVETADAEDVAALREAGLAAHRLTVETYGGGPTAPVVARAAELQRSAGGFKAFAPLPRAVSPVTPTTGYDDVKLVAMARLMTPAIPSIQVDWPLYGPKLAQVALTMGADDVDGIAAFDPPALGTRRSALAEITGNIRAAALEPVERDGRFESRE